MTAASDRFVGHALGVSWHDLGPSAQRAARNFLHDSLAVGIAGRNAALADEAFHAATGWSGQGGTGLVLGRPGARLTAPHAAFANGYQIHAQEYDCVHEPAVAHPMASVLAVLLAEASRAPVSGADFLAGIVAGVDIVASLGVAVKSPLKFFRPATAGVFGSIGGLCRMRQLTPEVSRNALGYGLAFASGTMQAHVEGKPALAIQVAAAARSAIEAADLARLGFEGSHGSIDGPFGYLSLFEDEVDLEPVLADLGKRHRIEELSWKPFPTGRAAHGAIIALRSLMERRGVTADNLRSFTYRAPPLIHRLVGRRPFAGMSVAYARLCFAWLGAVVLTRGTIDLADFTPERLSDPALLALAERIMVEVDDNGDPAAFVPAVGTAVLTNGTVVSDSVSRQFGSPEWPLSREEHLAKAERCLSFGGLGHAHRGLVDLIERFDELDDVVLALAAVIE
ncbi:MmgE/PrpD family protein [Novosphingobium sp. Leaf2]|uniref:MmgE/PrpD family protein n=1 Tax=Novosphingobium sp. Leaf2 TaxID=1735670 RepID=UPI0006F55583|nr:MmgE/PrpD family protein [Novosphingobium sp. Leaf2]KQM22205.1 2-methylcitrate dehydratase [Novosphingobium sp. Leaf2]